MESVSQPLDLSSCNDDDFDDQISDFFEECTATFALAAIEKFKLTGYRANSIFARWCATAPWETNVELVQKFMELGVDINEPNCWYGGDTGNCNAIHRACEFRDLNQIKVFIEVGADLEFIDKSEGSEEGSVVIDSYVYGHNPDYECLDDDEIDNWLKGFDMLINAGAKMTQNALDEISNSYRTSNKDLLIERAKKALTHS